MILSLNFRCLENYFFSLSLLTHLIFFLSFKERISAFRGYIFLTTTLKCTNFFLKYPSLLISISIKKRFICATSLLPIDRCPTTNCFKPMKFFAFNFLFFLLLGSRLRFHLGAFKTLLFLFLFIEFLSPYHPYPS
jgi:hypothetical protein